MYQAGVKNITLYENRGITFHHYDPLNLRAITDLSGIGNIITIENLQRPKLSIETKLSKTGKIVYDYNIKFILLGLSLETYNNLLQFQTSIYGWCFLVEFYDGSLKFFNTPLFCDKSKIDTNSEMLFEIEMNTATSALLPYYEYTANVSTVPVYRFDTELLTWDTEIYSFDYEL